MTALDMRATARAREDMPADASSGATDKRSSEASRHVCLLAMIALAVIVVAYALFQCFEGPIANAWYTNRQHQLASQLNAGQVHAGKGKAVAYLQIPALGLNVVVAEGDSPQQLRSGPGHRIGTVVPGDVGNSVIVGHSSGWGGPFGRLATLKPGALIAVQVPSIVGPDGLPRTGVFTVVSVDRVSANDLLPFAPSNDRRVTLVTGRGGQFSDQRLVITAVSGTVGTHVEPAHTIRASTSAGSLWWNGTAFLAVLAIAAAGTLTYSVRRRYHATAIAAFVTPLAALALFCVMLNVDAALPALR